MKKNFKKQNCTGMNQQKIYVFISQNQLINKRFMYMCLSNSLSDLSFILPNKEKKVFRLRIF